MVNTPYVQGCLDVSWTKKDSFLKPLHRKVAHLHFTQKLCYSTFHLRWLVCLFSQETSGLRLLEFSKWNRGRFHRGVVMFLRAKPPWIWKLFCLFFVMFYGFYYGKSPSFGTNIFGFFSNPPCASKSKVKLLWKSLPPKNSSSADATWLAAASVVFRLGESGILFDKQVDQRGIWRRQGSTPTHASICRRHEGEESEKEYWELCGVWCKDQNLDFPPRPGAEYHPCNFAGTYDSSTLRRLLYDRDVLLRFSEIKEAPEAWSMNRNEHFDPCSGWSRRRHGHIGIPEDDLLALYQTHKSPSF